MDGWVVVFVVDSFWHARSREGDLVALITLYGGTRILGLMATQAPIVDFAQAYKWLLYLLAFALAVGRHWARPESVATFTWSVLTIASLKYVEQTVRSPELRPTLFVENNFELAFFSGLVIVSYDLLGRHRYLAVVLLGLLVALSGSRSASVALVVVVIVAIGKADRQAALTRLAWLATLPALAAGAYAVFLRRASVTGVDRLNFLEFFLSETRGWGVADWLLGTPPITPLSPATCSALSYYVELFSSRGDGSCYSLILHVFVLRVIFDAGLLGLALAFCASYVAMRRAGVERVTALGLMGVALTNSMSVSGLNNAFVAIPILIAILTATPSRELADTLPRGRNLRTRTVLRSQMGNQPPAIGIGR